MSKKINEAARAVVAYLAGEKGATVPQVTGDGMARDVLAQVIANAQRAEDGRYCLLLATVLATAATSAVTAGPKDVNALNEAVPFHHDANTRKQYAFTLRLCVAAHGPCFHATDRTSYAAVYGEALAYARGVNVTEEKRARDKARKAKMASEAARASDDAAAEGRAPAPKASIPSTVMAVAKMTDAKLAQATLDLVTELARRVAEGNQGLVESLAMVRAALAHAPKAKRSRPAKAQEPATMVA